jgi:hypothetical protein
MTDIVERLRNDVCLFSRLDWQDHVALAKAAADEIDQLRKALADCAERFRRCCIASGSDPEYADAAVAEYRDALANLNGGKS